MSISELQGEDGRNAVLKAIAEYDRLGRDEFLAKHGYGPARKYVLIHKGRHYDSKAIAGVAFGIQYPDREIPVHYGGAQSTEPLKALQFQVVDLSTGAEKVAPSLGWKKLVEAGKRSYAKPGFEDRERNYKLEIAKAFRQIIEESQSNTSWPEDLRRALGRSYLGTTYNLSHPQWDHSWLRSLDGEAAADVRMAFGSFLDEVDHIARFDLWADVTRKHAPERERLPGSILAVGSMLNFALDPKNLPPVKAGPFGDAERDVGFKGDQESPTSAYASHLEFAHLARSEFEDAGLPIHDMLDVQSVIWEFYYTRLEAKKAKVVDPPAEPISRHEGWLQDEIILAVNLLNQTDGNPSREEIGELSERLRSFPVESHLSSDPEFRNPAEVEGKLSELNETRHERDPEALGRVADEIRAAMDSTQASAFSKSTDRTTAEATEGRLLTGVHTYRERDPKITRLKKLEARETYGRLACEACKFDFAEEYGELGDGYIECHHLVPLSQIEVERKTTLDDLALLCANCHRMVHAGDPWLELDELRALLNQTAD